MVGLWVGGVVGLWGGGPCDFSLRPRPHGFWLWTNRFGAQSLGPGLDNFSGNFSYWLLNVQCLLKFNIADTVIP